MASGNFRADHIGGLFPVPGAAGEFQDDELGGVIDAQIRAVLDAFTDGEPWRARAASPAAQLSSGRIADAPGELGRLRERAPSWSALKVSLPVPGAITATGGAGHSDASEAVVAAARALLEQGVDYLQFDASAYAAAVAAGELTPAAVRDLLKDDADALGELTPGEDAATSVALGSAAPYIADPALADALLALPVARFMFPVTPADDGFAMVRALPEDRFAVLGLVDASTTDLEQPDPLLALVDEAEAIHGDRLAVSASRGFGAWEGVAGMTPLAQYEKLALVSDVARMLWGTEL